VTDARARLVVLGLVLMIGAVTAVDSRSALSGCNGFSPTPSQIGGTHFKASPLRRSVVEPGLKGTRISLTGFVLTTDCKAVRAARVDFWQADANGVYDDQGTRLRSHQFTDAQGRYSLETILPGPYANRTRHLHVTVRALGEQPVTTMLYFPGVALNAHDPFFDRHLLVRLEIVKRRFLARFDFVLRSR
jgi:protocatechuate 3,4-dioxygenase beta subunit